MLKSFAKFSYADVKLALSNKRVVQTFVVSIVEQEIGKPCRLHYIFCSDAFLHQMNVDYLGHDDFTDIITFDLSRDRNTCIEGEIYISVDRVAENSRVFSSGFEEEMLRVIFHGVLHLCGYTDKSKGDIAEMREREGFYIRLYRKLGLK